MPQMGTLRHKDSISGGAFEVDMAVLVMLDCV